MAGQTRSYAPIDLAGHLLVMVKVIGPLASHHASGRMSAPRVYSSSLRNRHDREAPPPPPPPEHDYILTGDITPDAIGYYDEAGTSGGKPYYANEAKGFLLWWHPDNLAWFISTELELFEDSWYRIAENPLGEYTPYSSHTGYPILSEA